MNDFNDNLYDQLLNRLTSYNNHWSTKSIKTSENSSYGQNLILDEIHTKEFGLFDVYLVSASQVQGLDTRRATKERCETEKLKNVQKHKN